MKILNNVLKSESKNIICYIKFEVSTVIVEPQSNSKQSRS